jgi:Na+/melibiose symporter-like transporter
LCLWLILGGGIVLAGFIEWEAWRTRRGRAVLVDPAMLRVPRLRAGLVSFFFQFLLQAGLFFVVPLFLSVALGLSAVATGVRLLPLSLALLFSAALVPRLFRNGSPRRIVRAGFALVFLGLLVLVLALDQGAGPEVVTVPLILIGIGIGALASQLGAVTVSAVPDDKSSEVGGLQYTVTNLGASIGTALAGAVLISVLTTTFLTGISNNPAVPQEMSSKAQVELSAGIPFVSDAQLQSALQSAGVPSSTAQAITEQNAASRINGLRASIALLAIIDLLALALTRRLPETPMGIDEVAAAEAKRDRERARSPPG